MLSLFLKRKIFEMFLFYLGVAQIFDYWVDWTDQIEKIIKKISAIEKIG